MGAQCHRDHRRSDNSRGTSITNRRRTVTVALLGTAVIVAAVAVAIVASSGAPVKARARSAPTTSTTNQATGPHAAIPPSAVPIAAGSDAQAVVNAHPSGTTFVIDPGLHMGFSVLPKAGDLFYSEPSAVLDGGGTTGAAFYAYTSSSGPGPAGVTIEGYSADQRLVIRNYSDGHAEQMGTVQPTFGPTDPKIRADRWTLRWVEVTASYSRGVTTSDDMVVDGCLIDHNGRLGIGGTGNDIVVEGTEIAFNNTRGVPEGFENGGGKFSSTTGLMVRNDYSHDNDGPGFWTDVDALDSTFQGNTITNNSGPGILAEISHHLVISSNTISNNGVQHHAALKGGGIVASTSDNLDIFDNVLDGNGNGITAIQQNRGSGRLGVRTLDNLSVHDNTVRDSGISGVAEYVGDPSVFSRNLHFLHNTYQAETFAWMGKRDLSWAQWQSAGQDQSGSWSA